MVLRFWFDVIFCSLGVLGHLALLAVLVFWVTLEC